ncbi:DUF3006 domain-containing protein [Bacillaceae bacterium W0354]
MKKYKAVLDRIEDQYAVILAESVNKEFLVAQSELPEGSEEGTWFIVSTENGEIIDLTIDENKTEARKNQISEKLNRLRNKKSGSKFKRN